VGVALFHVERQTDIQMEWLIDHQTD